MTNPSLKETNPKLWSCIVPVVLQWIYEIISNYSLNKSLNVSQQLIFFGKNYLKLFFLQEVFKDSLSETRVLMSENQEIF